MAVQIKIYWSALRIQKRFDYWYRLLKLGFKYNSEITD